MCSKFIFSKFMLCVCWRPKIGRFWKATGHWAGLMACIQGDFSWVGIQVWGEDPEDTQVSLPGALLPSTFSAHPFPLSSFLSPLLPHNLQFPPYSVSFLPIPTRTWRAPVTSQAEETMTKVSFLFPNSKHNHEKEMKFAMNIAWHPNLPEFLFVPSSN